MTENRLGAVRLSLDDLSALRAAMAVGFLEECCPDVWSGATVRGLVAEHNAIPVLIEVARAALRLRAAGRSASRARQGVPWTASSQSAEEEVSRTNAEWRAAHEALDAALAKVTCSVQAPPEDPPASRPAMSRNHVAFQAESEQRQTLDPVAPPIAPEDRTSILLAILKERKRQLREAMSVGPDGEPMASDAEVVAYRRLVAELQTELERRNHEASATNAAADGPPAARPEHNDGPRSECPGCVHADAKRAEAIAAARKQLAKDDYYQHAQNERYDGNCLAKLLLRALGETP